MRELMRSKERKDSRVGVLGLKVEVCDLWKEEIKVKGWMTRQVTFSTSVRSSLFLSDSGSIPSWSKYCTFIFNSQAAVRSSALGFTGEGAYWNQHNTHTHAHPWAECKLTGRGRGAVCNNSTETTEISLKCTTKSLKAAGGMDTYSCLQAHTHCSKQWRLFKHEFAT